MQQFFSTTCKIVSLEKKKVYLEIHSLNTKLYLILMVPSNLNLPMIL